MGLGLLFKLAFMPLSYSKLVPRFLPHGGKLSASVATFKSLFPSSFAPHP
jgi:hypothetical protein